MRRLSIFLYFLILTTLSLRLGDFYATLLSVVGFIILYYWAELLDKEDNDDLVESKHSRKEKRF